MYIVLRVTCTCQYSNVCTCTCIIIVTDRNNSEISVSMCDTLEGEESTVPYDYLVITTGSQYIPERPINERVPEEGVITINGNFGDKQRLEKAKQQIANDGKEKRNSNYMYMDVYSNCHFVQ